MTVKELIEELSGFDPETEVKFSYPSKDYWGSVLARDISNIGYELTKYSGYHQTDKIIDVGDNDEDEDTKEVLVLS
jgi:hypothetical protein